MLEYTLDMEQYDCPFIDVSADFDVRFAAFQWEFDQNERELETRMTVDGADEAALANGLDALRAHDRLRTCHLLARHDDRAQVRTRIGETEAMSVIREHDGYVTGPFRVADGSERWHVGFDDGSVASDALTALDDDNEFTVRNRERLGADDVPREALDCDPVHELVDESLSLSAVERRTLERAVRDGYFDVPRGTTLGEIAGSFDVSKPAASENLRRSQRKVLQRVVSLIEFLDSPAPGPE
ncbi:helix-turn-helix domain-containing protein [Halorientalis pallida]|uniref:Helix-turn-helix domain-containing protein n=1 Tax=Halorientalis pallida TaxID=2479928 RepID=A0A498KYX8_9EURY|nr:helix-turn-helix domain-containing protein [Halorientalis pallida]RXK51279.1 helix-turn-helix domain-containing protein [Halorientalis pallida]